MKKKRCSEDKNIIVDNSHIPTHGVAIFANSKIVCSTAVAAACTGVTSVAAMAAAIKRNYMTDMDVIDDTNSTHSTKKKK